MKKFKFSLDKVLMQKEIKVELAQKDFAEAVAAMDEVGQKLQHMIAQKDSAFKQRHETVQGSTSWGNAVDQINVFLVGQDLRIKQQHERLSESKKVVESRREILQQALTEAKMIERLREKKKEEYFQEAALKEQQEVDEISVLRFPRVERE